MKQTEAEAATCGGCDARWTGLAYAHCARCHHTFSGVVLFDKHRRAGRCVHPATIRIKGEPVILRGTGVWHAPAMPDDVLRLLAADVDSRP